MASCASRTQPRVAPVPAILVAAVLLLVSGCKDPTVDVFRPTDQFQFSLFGALDVAADTQVVRVEPLDDSIQVGAPPTLDATLILENLDSGEQIRLQDSLATFGSDPVVVHNFWTTHSIEPSTSYRIAVRREGEPVATATTTTPARAPELSVGGTALELPCIFPEDPNDQLKPQNSFRVVARNVGRLASVVVTYPISDAPPFIPRSVPHLKGAEKFEDLFRVTVFYRPDLVALNPDQAAPSREPSCASQSDFARPSVKVAVAAGGPDWPKWRGAPLDEIARPNSFSNVKGGHGFVGATYSDTVEVPVLGRN